MSSYKSHLDFLEETRYRKTAKPLKVRNGRTSDFKN